MAVEITGLAVKVSDEGIEATERKLEQLTDATKGAEEATEELADSSDAAAEAMDAYAVRAEAVSPALAKLGTFMKAIPWAAIAKGIFDVTANLVEVGVEADNMRAELATSFDDSADAVMNWIEQFHVNVPMSLRETKDAFSTLYEFGIDPTSGALQNMVDIAAGSAAGMDSLGNIVDAFGTAFARGAANTEDMTRLLGAGINAYEELGEVLGKPTEAIEKMVKAGQIGQEEMAKLWEHIGGDRAGSALEVMDTIPGKIEQINKKYQNWLRSAAGENLIGPIKAALDQIIEKWDEIFSPERAATFGSIAAKVIAGLALAVEAIFGVIPAAIEVAVVGAELAISRILEKILNLQTMAINFAGEMVEKMIGEESAKIFRALAPAVADQLTPDFIEDWALAGDELATTFEGAKTELKTASDNMAQFTRDLIEAGDASKDLKTNLEMPDMSGSGDGGGPVMSLGMAQIGEDLAQLQSDLTNAMLDVQLALVPQVDFDLLNDEVNLYTENWNEAEEAIFQTNDTLTLTESLSEGTSRALLSAAAAWAMFIKAGGSTGGRLVNALKKLGKETSVIAEEMKELKITSPDQIVSEQVLRTVAERLEIPFEALKEAMQGVDDEAEDFFDKMEDMSERLKDLMKNEIAGGFADALKAMFSGDTEGLEDIVGDLFGSMADAAIQSFSTMFTEALFTEGGLSDLFSGEGGIAAMFDGSPENAVMGAGMAFDAAMNGPGGAMGALQGAIGGAMAGAIFGPVGMVVGGVIGGLMGLFGGQKEKKPETSITIVDGQVTGIGTRNQGVTDAENALIQKDVDSVIRNMRRQYIDVLRIFGDPELFDRIKDDFSLNLSEAMDVDDFMQLLEMERLPNEFQRQFGEAFRHGFRQLGLTGDALRQFWQEVRSMPGPERIEAFTAVAGSLVALNEFLDNDFESLTEQALMTPFESFFVMLDDAEEQIAMLQTGWADMELIERAEDLENIANVAADVGNAFANMIADLEAVRRSLEEMFQGMRDQIETAGLGDEELWNWFEDRYNAILVELQNTTDPEEILRLSQEASGFLMQAFGMLSPEMLDQIIPELGITWREWFLQQVGALDGMANEAADEVEAALQARWDQFYDRVEAAGVSFSDIGDAVEDLGGDFDGLGDDIDRLRDRFALWYQNDDDWGGTKSTSAASTKSGDVDPPPDDSVPYYGGDLSQPVNMPSDTSIVVGAVAESQNMQNEMLRSMIAELSTAVQRDKEPDDVNVQVVLSGSLAALAGQIQQVATRVDRASRGKKGPLD